MTANYVLLERIELAAKAALVSFTNIPQSGYTDLKMVISARSDESGGSAQSTNYFLAINGVSTNRSWIVVGAYGGTNVYSSSGTTGKIGTIPGTAVTANTFNSTEIYFPSYLSSAYKSYSVDTVTENNSSSNNDIGMFAGLWSDTAAISSLTVTSGAGNLVAGSTFSIYGLAAVGTTPTIYPKASGGNIQTDNTYWYHTFLSSGTFTPFTDLSCDVLTIAGGGSGGNFGGGGGGAGGLVYSASQSLTTTGYSVTIGAGGASTIYNSGSRGNSGSNSQFASLTAAVGGGAGGGSGSTPLTGGSGGGGFGTGAGGTQLGASGTSGQGNAGGSNGAYNGSPYPGGGGGGAGASGLNATGNSAAGVGGAGTNTYSSWASATNTGVSGYYAGGGAGGYFSTGGSSKSGGAGGGGNNAIGQYDSGVAGTTSTGSGGGACVSGVSGAGGSGIVIVRYAV